MKFCYKHFTDLLLVIMYSNSPGELYKEDTKMQNLTCDTRVSVELEDRDLSSPEVKEKIHELLHIYARASTLQYTQIIKTQYWQKPKG